jgi:hypothetical protein
MKRFSWLLFSAPLFMFVFCYSATAQIREFGNFVTTGNQDAEALLNAYLAPYANALGAGMTGGWYNTAESHKPGGFDISFTISTAIVPSEYRSFVVDNLELEHLSRIPETSEESFTLAGDYTDGPQMHYDFDGFDSAAYFLPPGSGIPVVPCPVIQAGIGIFKGTDILGRYMPNVGVEGKGKYGFWGVGIKHDIKQWIPFLRNTPILDLSFMAGYTRLNSYINLNVNPSSVGLENYTTDLAATLWDNQRLIATANSFTSSLLLSATLPVVTFYGGVGLAYFKSDLLLEGTYPVITGIGTENQEPIIISADDPLEMEVGNIEGGSTKVRLNIGARFRFFKIGMLNIDYTKANFDIVTVGLGISFR